MRTQVIVTAALLCMISLSLASLSYYVILGADNAENKDEISLDWSLVDRNYPENGGVEKVCELENLDLCYDETDCKLAGGYWYYGRCNENPEKELVCDEDNLKFCFNEDDCEDEGGYWYDEMCHEDREERDEDECESHAFSQCYDGDIYWYDSCGELDEIKLECGNSSTGEWGGAYCSGNNVVESRTNYERGCSGNYCYSLPWTETNVLETCAYGCSAGECNERISLSQGVNIFSLPKYIAGGISFNELSSDCVLELNRAGSACPEGERSIVEYNPLTESYNCLDLDDKLYAGQGYYIKVVDSCYVDSSGSSFSFIDDVLGWLGTGILNAGWNLIGSLSNQTDFNAGTCQLYGGVGILKYGYDVSNCWDVEGYTGGYQDCQIKDSVNRCKCEVNYFEPGQGYWIRTANDCSLGE